MTLESGISPLECPDTTVLPLNSNCVRRAKWDATLGQIPPSLTFSFTGVQNGSSVYPFGLKSLKYNGGMIPLVDVVIERVYPPRYMETRSSFGSVVTPFSRLDFLSTKCQ